MTFMLRFALSTALGWCLLAGGSARAQEPAPEFPKLDLTLYAGPLISSRRHPAVDDAGFSLGISATVRLGKLFGLGLQLEHNVFGWDAQGGIMSNGNIAPGSAFPDEDGSISHQLALLMARFYIVRTESVDLHTQVGLGYGALTYTPEHPDCDEIDIVAGQLGLGTEYRASRALGLHIGVAAWPFGLGMGCNENGYEGRPSNAPFMDTVIGLRAGVTTVWE
jgi:hypothetical protein